MTTIIVLGPRCDADLAAEAAQRLGGALEQRADHYRVHARRAPSADELGALRAALACDINPLPAEFAPDRVRLLITDMDSTLIGIECIDEIADFAGLKPQVAAITEAAMRGELNFEQSLTRRVALLAGLDAAALDHVYEERLRLNPGAERLLDGLRARGIKTALVSGGFTFFTERLRRRLGLDYARANTLEVVDGKLTGRVLGDIVGAEGKRAFLLALCAELGIAPAQAVAMGDGANDLPMMKAAGLSVAYRAKPKVQAEARAALNHAGLDGVLALIEADRGGPG